MVQSHLSLEDSLPITRRSFLSLPLFRFDDAPHGYFYENVMGTSMELFVFAADEGAARAAETAVLAEIDRLCKILSTYDASSEISLLGRFGFVSRCSGELGELLSAYEHWSRRTSG